MNKVQICSARTTPKDTKLRRPILNIPTTLSDFSKDLKPEEIDKVEEYTLLNTLYSPLVLFDNNGHLIANFATRFFWEDDTTLVFYFEREQKTVDGYLLGAEDALFSIKRLILLDKNAHGRIADRIEVPSNFRSIYDDLPSINIKDNKLFIRTKKKDPFILHILASADYAVLPKISVDLETLKIKDFRNTSGPYFLESEDKDVAVLKANPSHFRLLENNATEIRCLKLGRTMEPIIKAFKDKIIDHIPTDSVLTKAAYFDLSHLQGVTLHEARDVMLAFGVFTKASRQKFTPLERFVVAEKFQEIIRKHAKQITPFANPTDEFFLEEGVGGLSKNILEASKNEFQKKAFDAKIEARNLSITIEAFPNMNTIIEPLFKGEFKDVKFIPTKPRNTVNESDADILLGSIDIGLKEDFTGISFAMSKGYFDLTEAEGREWLNVARRTPTSFDTVGAEHFWS